MRETLPGLLTVLEYRKMLRTVNSRRDGPRSVASAYSAKKTIVLSNSRRVTRNRNDPGSPRRYGRDDG